MQMKHFKMNTLYFKFHVKSWLFIIGLSILGFIPGFFRVDLDVMIFMLYSVVNRMIIIIIIIDKRANENM